MNSRSVRKQLAEVNSRSLLNAARGTLGNTSMPREPGLGGDCDACLSSLACGRPCTERMLRSQVPLYFMLFWLKPLSTYFARAQ